MDIGSCFPSKWLESRDFPSPQVLVMEDVTIETVGAEEEDLPVVWFRGETKGLVLNKTNANTIASMYGTETEKWAGEPIEVYASETSYQGKMVPCTRVKSQIPTKRAPAKRRTAKTKRGGTDAKQTRRRKPKSDGD